MLLKTAQWRARACQPTAGITSTSPKIGWRSSNQLVLCRIVLYCIDGMVIAVQCTVTFSRSIVLPRI